MLDSNIPCDGLQECGADTIEVVQMVDPDEATEGGLRDSSGICEMSLRHMVISQIVSDAFSASLRRLRGSFVF